MQFPSLPKLSALPSKYDKIDFSGTVLVGIQHLLASNGTMLELLNENGLAYERMFLLGKVYSTNATVYEELVARKTQCSPLSVKAERIEPEKDYKLQLGEAAKELLQQAIKKLDSLSSTHKTLLVVDDGGVLLGAVNSQVGKTKARVVGVEQTRSGAEALRGILDLSFPVINVAESNKKLQDESPYIAASIVEHVAKKMRSLPVVQLTNSKVLVVGHGAVGKQVTRRLGSLVKTVHSHDINKSLSPHLIADLRTELPSFDVVIGCVGKPWLPSDYRKLLKDQVVLASGSSSNTEFLGVTDFLKQVKDVHDDYCFRHSKGLGWLLNAGFPVNFDGSIDPIAPKTIELTRMLMLNGILQAATTSAQCGLQHLDVVF